MMNVNKIREAIEAKPARSAWSRGVKLYAYDLLDSLDEAITGGYFDADDLSSPKLVSRAMLNGADCWNQYSWGGSALCYDGDIAIRLCTPSELKRTDNGTKRPNASEHWLDVQARALYQAAEAILGVIREEAHA